jgi:hypothetical protein
MDLYDQSCQMGAIRILHSPHENGIKCYHNTSGQFNLFLFTNVETLLGLNAMMPLLEVVHSLIKFAQLRDVFVCDFISIVKIC